LGGTRCRYWEKERLISRFDGESEGKRPTGRTRHRWEDNIKMVLLVIDEYVWVLFIHEHLNSIY